MPHEPAATHDRHIAKEHALRTRIVVPVLLTTSVVLGATTWLGTRKVSDAMQKDAIRTSQDLAHRYGNQLRLHVEGALRLTTSYGQMMEALRSGGPLSRDDVNRSLKHIAERNPSLLGTWTVWEPDAFDGRDREFVGAPGHDESGRFIPYWNRGSGQVTLEPNKDYDKPGIGDYYQLPKQTKLPTILNPYVYPVNGKDTLITSVTYPMFVESRFVGVSGADLSLSELSDIVGKLRPYGSGQVSVLTPAGVYVAHPDVAKLNTRLENMPGTGDEKSLISSGREAHVQYFDQGLGAEVLRVFVPIAFAGTQNVWTISVAAPLSAVLAGARQAALWQAGFAAAGLAVLGVVLFVLVGLVTRTLTAMAERLTTGGERILEAAAQLAAASQSLSMATGEQASSVEETSSSLEELSGIIRKNVETVEGSVTLAKDTVHAIEVSGASVRSLEQAMHGIVTGNERIAELQRVIADIAEKTKIMDEIVFQTRLLSFNASVEAERAGEHGRGFAVVAQEVGNLAQLSGKAAKEIALIVQNSLKVTEEVTLENRKRVDSGAGLVAETAARLKDISSFSERLLEGSAQVFKASEEQSAGVEQINKAIVEIDKATQQNAATAEEAASASEELAAQARALSDISRELLRLVHGGISDATRTDAAG